MSLPPPRPGPAQGTLGVLGYGLLAAPGVARIMALSGWPLRAGLFHRQDGLAVWGQRPSGRRARALAALTGRGLIQIEEAFLRGATRGRGSGLPPYGLLIDRLGIHYDASQPSEIEQILAQAPLDDPALLARAETGLARLKALGFGKYTAHDPDAPLPPDGSVLLVDQVRGDASVAASGADRASFLALLDRARTDHPDRPLVLRAPPGARGHLGPGDLRPGELWHAAPVSPWALLGRAHKVYAVSSQLGLEAIWAGHRPVLAGAPIYAGWGLSDDPVPLPRRGRPLTPIQLFAGLMLLAPRWYDPFRDQLTSFETILEIAEAEAKAAREDAKGYDAVQMRLWKRRHMARVFGGDVRFRAPRPGTTHRTMIWGAAPLSFAGPAAASESAHTPDPAPTTSAAPTPLIRVEDGFLRSRGLGARLVPPLSLIADPEGIYYDPSRPSRLERLIAQSPDLPPWELARARRLTDRIIALGATKYGQGGARPTLPEDGRPRILVVGQVENDASIQLGATGPVRDTAGLLRAARAAHPEACLLYKPHPDVEAGLRPGALTAPEANLVLAGADPAWLLGQVDGLWTLTSLMGFEALLRGLPVTCLGAPFYAGWGLSEDRGPVPERRRGPVSIEGLAHAALIGAPRYWDPRSGRICPPEVALERLEAMAVGQGRSRAQRWAAKAQGVWATLRPR